MFPTHRLNPWTYMVTTDVQPRKEVGESQKWLRAHHCQESSWLRTRRITLNYVCKLAEKVFGSEEELDVGTWHYCSEAILVRKWQPSTAPANEEWHMVHQVVVPKMHRREVLHLAHASPMGGHLRRTRRFWIIFIDQDSRRMSHNSVSHLICVRWLVSLTNLSL